MKVIVAGDFASRGRLSDLIENKQYSDIFTEDLCNLVNSADFSFVNFEAPVVENSSAPIIKCGPNLKCTQNSIEAVKYAGFTGVTMANNHILDYGSRGLYSTLEFCTKHGLSVVGAGDNIKTAEKPLYLVKNNEKIAIINCCENEFSVADDNKAGANPLNPISQYYSIQEAKKEADYVLVIVHGGHEYYQLPSPRMKEIYRFFIDVGADAVINHHQHCYSGYEFYKGKPIFYGLGNFCFDKVPFEQETSWNYGYMVELIFDKTISFKLYPYIQCGLIPGVQMLPSNAFEASISHLNSIILSDELLKSTFDDYCIKSVNSELRVLEPYSRRITVKLFSIGLLPKFIKRSKVLQILNHVKCEAHRDKLIFALQQNLK